MFDRRQIFAVARPVREGAEGDAVAARQAVCGGDGRGIVTMRDVPDCVERKGQQHCRERNSQPPRRPSCQIEDGHGPEGYKFARIL